MSNVELKNTVSFNKFAKLVLIDGAKPPARRGFSAYASESDNLHSSIFNRHSTFQKGKNDDEDLP